METWMRRGRVRWGWPARLRGGGRGGGGGATGPRAGACAVAAHVWGGGSWMGMTHEMGKGLGALGISLIAVTTGSYCSLYRQILLGCARQRLC